MQETFPFNETCEIDVEIKIYYKENSERKAFILTGVIKYDNSLWLHITFDKTQDDSFSLAHKLLSKGVAKKNFKITKAYIGDVGISLSVEDKSLEMHRLEQGAVNIISIQLKKISYQYKGTNDQPTYRLSSIISPLFFTYLNDIYIGNGKLSLRERTIEGKIYGKSFSLHKVNNNVYLQTNEKNWKSLLLIFSLFFGNAVESDMQSTPLCNGQIKVDVMPPGYKILSRTNNFALGYLHTGNKYFSRFGDFLSMANSISEITFGNKYFNLCIENFVRAAYLDEVSQLTIYTTILERLANVKNDTYGEIKSYLSDNNIDVKKLNDNVAQAKIRNEKRGNVENFVQLRNFFVHHMGSDKGIQFLKESDMLFNMKLAINILLLKKIGMRDIEFRHDFKHLSIYLEEQPTNNVKRTRKCKITGIWHYIQNMFTNRV